MGDNRGSAEPMLAQAIKRHDTHVVEEKHPIHRFQLRSKGRSCIEHMTVFLRTIGFNIIAYLRGDEDEPPKVLIDRSRRLALVRCIIHVAPAAVSLCLVYFNLMGYFIGRELQGPSGQDEVKMGMMQIAAKVQELLVVASIGSVIFHVLRSELVFGEGVPLGLLVSGFSFAQISYFWSAEFWGGIHCGQTMRSRERWKRYGFLLLVFAGGMLALLAGPASAVLMIPRSRAQLIGGGIYWLNGTEGDLFPTDLSAEYYSDFDCANETQRFLDDRCPSAGFIPLFQHYQTGWNLLDSSFKFEIRDASMRKSVYNYPSLLADANTWAITAHAPTAMLQDAMRSVHASAVNTLFNVAPAKKPYPQHMTWASTVRFDVGSRAPAVRALCRPQGMLNFTGDQLNITFADLSGFDDWWTGKPPPPRAYMTPPAWAELDVLSTVKKHISSRGLLSNETAAIPDDFFNQTGSLVIPIDLSVATGDSLGLLLMLKETWNSTNIDIPASNMLACTIDARWAKSKSILIPGVTALLLHDNINGKVRNLVDTELNLDVNSDPMGYVRWKPPLDDTMPAINLRTDWFDTLSPVIPETVPEGMPWFPPGDRHHTTAETLLDVMYDPIESSKNEFETLVTTFIADGLSRSGNIPNFNASRFLGPLAPPVGDFSVHDEHSARTLVRQGRPKETFPEPEIIKPGGTTRFEMHAYYTGYVMEATSWFDYISIAALLFHALIALVHTILVIWYGQTSGAWDTILEMLALSQMSPPPSQSTFVNASAGIRSFKTVKLLASVDVPKNGLEPGRELQLTVKDDLQRRDPELKPVVGEVYGSVPKEYAYRRVHKTV